MGHMHQSPNGVWSTRMQTKRVQTANTLHVLEHDDASVDATTIPVQEPQNKKTHSVFMTVKLADNFIASDRTGAFPRV
jgi:hypothetical protein